MAQTERGNIRAELRDERTNQKRVGVSCSSKGGREHGDASLIGRWTQCIAMVVLVCQCCPAALL